MRTRPWLSISLAVLGASGCTAKGGEGPPEAVRETLRQVMPPLDGARLEVAVVEVRYAPGAGSAPHRHTCPVIGHVVEGALRTQVRGGPVEIFRAGQTFYEPPNGVHEVSANASDREPVRFTATFLCDHPAPHTTGAPAPAGATP